MKRKFLKKITVSARFKTQILTQDKFKDLTDEESEEVWNSYLKALADTRQISIHQSKTWKYPNKFL
jgi:nitrate/TMAO reductase-like tetraheme cytochrome c subunit